MGSEENKIELNLLSHYGGCFASYRGEGAMTYDDGQKLTCKFEAGQLNNGEVLLLCDFDSPPPFFNELSPVKFEGKTSEGFELWADGGVSGTNYLPGRQAGSSQSGEAFRLREMFVRMAKDDRPHSARFGLTNFKFIGTEAHKTARSHVLALPLNLQSCASLTKIKIVPVEDYEYVILRAQTLHGIEVTCEAFGEILTGGGVERLTETVDDLCRLLSVARGTKVQWIYRDLYDENGVCVSRYHYSAVTKPYCALVILDPYAEGRHETKIFLEGAYAPYIQKRDSYKLNQGTIDAYLDAKADHDYLETRGAKLAVALEKLKAVFFAASGGTAKEFILDEAVFEKLVAPLQKAIDGVLEGAVPDKTTHQAIANEGKVLSLNRRSFSYALRKLCKDIDLKVSATEIEMFIQFRNKLVHTGEFYCVAATTNERAKCPPLPTAAEEYYFLVNFLDRIFLRLLGYSGRYVDWRKSKGSLQKDTV